MRWFGRGRRDALERPLWAPRRPPPPPGAWRAAAASLGDGEPLGEAMLAGLAADLVGRTDGFVAGWPPPRLTGLRVRRHGLPGWWADGGNLMLAGPDTRPGELTAAHEGTPRGALLTLGERAALRQAILGGEGAIVALGDGVHFPLAGIQANDATVLVGEESNATVFAQIDARNGGCVLIGADAMIAGGARIITDDMHTIRDRATGARLNHRGGRVAIGRHVWLGEQVLIAGETVIGEDSVVGSGSLAKGVALPAHAICAGRPVRVTRTGATWTREDEP